MQIIIDTREQKPLKLRCRGCAIWRKTMVAGDYTTAKLAGKFHVERKSLQDLYGTLTKGNRRFKKEIWRAWERSIELVIMVEGPAANFYNKRFPGGERRQFPGSGLKKMVETFTGPRYGLEFVWCKSRKHMAEVLLKRLKKEESQL